MRLAGRTFFVEDKRMRKTMLLVLTIAVVMCACIVLAACSNQDTPSNDSKQSGYALNFNTVYALAEENGYTGTLEDLVALFKGKNAYELAVAAQGRPLFVS